MDATVENEPVNILLIDGGTENRQAMAALPDAPDYHIVQAGSGEEALGCLSKMDFAVILLDAQMPDADCLPIPGSRPEVFFLPRSRNIPKGPRCLFPLV